MVRVVHKLETPLLTQQHDQSASSPIQTLSKEASIQMQRRLVKNPILHKLYLLYGELVG
jgi:hypothetical protein